MSEKKKIAVVQEDGRLRYPSGKLSPKSGKEALDWAYSHGWEVYRWARRSLGGDFMRLYAGADKYYDLLIEAEGEGSRIRLWNENDYRDLWTAKVPALGTASAERRADVILDWFHRNVRDQCYDVRDPDAFLQRLKKRVPVVIVYRNTPDGVHEQVHLNDPDGKPWTEEALYGPPGLSTLNDPEGKPRTEDERAAAVLSWTFTQTQVDVAPGYKPTQRKIAVVDNNRLWFPGPSAYLEASVANIMASLSGGFEIYTWVHLLGSRCRLAYYSADGLLKVADETEYPSENTKAYRDALLSGRVLPEDLPDYAKDHIHVDASQGAVTVNLPPSDPKDIQFRPVNVTAYASRDGVVSDLEHGPPTPVLSPWDTEIVPERAPESPYWTVTKARQTPDGFVHLEGAEAPSQKVDPNTPWTFKGASIHMPHIPYTQMQAAAQAAAEELEAKYRRRAEMMEEQYKQQNPEKEKTMTSAREKIKDMTDAELEALLAPKTAPTTKDMVVDSLKTGALVVGATEAERLILDRVKAALGETYPELAKHPLAEETIKILAPIVIHHFATTYAGSIPGAPHIATACHYATQGNIQRNMTTIVQYVLPLLGDLAKLGAKLASAEGQGNVFLMAESLPEEVGWASERVSEKAKVGGGA